jgi:hypothetical protein
MLVHEELRMVKYLNGLSADQKRICNERIIAIWNDNGLTREMIVTIAEKLIAMARGQI